MRGLVTFSIKKIALYCNFVEIIWNEHIYTQTFWPFLQIYVNSFRICQRLHLTNGNMQTERHIKKLLYLTYKVSKVHYTQFCVCWIEMRQKKKKNCHKYHFVRKSSIYKWFCVECTQTPVKPADYFRRWGFLAIRMCTYFSQSQRKCLDNRLLTNMHVNVCVAVCACAGISKRNKLVPNCYMIFM